MKVKVKDMDWATMIEMRTNRDSVSKGGWNIFHTWWMAADVIDPTSIVFSGDPVSGWHGWPDDKEIEKYRSQFFLAKTLKEKKALASKVQERILEIGALGVLGQFFEPVAYRDDVTGITSPVQFYWGMSKE
jgi:peptide/nickel transport system substrate-binding protein